jgi:predicted RNase H-like nuclease (RuvC/YqgF family)
MSKPIGGRGNKAPYKSTHVRVPIPIKSEVQALIDGFRERYSEQPKKVLTPLDETEEEEDEDEEDDENSEPSDLETIKSQAEMIQRYAFEIHALKRDLDKLNTLTGLDEAKDLARTILRSKKSASQSLAKLLTSIYQVEVTVENLR